MNKFPLYLLLFLIVCLSGCDTKDNVPVRNENFFIKLYAGKTAGNQVGTDVIETSDGGLLIVGTSFGDSHTELLLIKTDSKGNEEWTYGADTTLNLQSSVGKSIIELPDGYVVGGTVIDGSSSRSLLLKIGFDGSFTGDSTSVITEQGGTEYNNTLSKITLGASGILVSGETIRPTSGGAGGINGFIRLYDPTTFIPVPKGTSDIQYFGVAGDDKVTGAYEVQDLVNNIGSESIEFLVFGTTEENNISSNFYHYGLKNDFTTPLSFAKLEWPGNQSANYLNRINDRYVLVGSSDENTPRIFLMELGFNPDGENDWQTTAGSGVISSNEVVEGKGVSFQGSNKKIIVGDEIITRDENTLIYLVGVTNTIGIQSPWPRTFGTNSSTYSSSAVTVLQDGSIVMVGTADLEPIKKILVIKTGPDGQMSF